jgi:DNA polymerase-3 subunit epsilon
MAREIVLDTETTGLDPRQGHRLVEIACVELVDLLPTGRHFHSYINPRRDIDPEAERVHGLSRGFLADKPAFEHDDVAGALLAFIGDSPIIAHNAPFDRGFVNHELTLAKRPVLPDARWIDSLILAQKRFPGLHNSLDALCKRFKISLAEREKHGALVDTRLLAGVYLELRGGREATLDLAQPGAGSERTGMMRDGLADVVVEIRHGPRPRPLAPRVSREEQAAHDSFIAREIKGEILWLSRGA